MSIGVYIIENTLNGKFYIGSAAKSIESRWKDHLKDLRGNRHHSERLQNSFNKYSETVFKMRVLVECDSSEVIKKEQFFIDTLEPEYNMNPIAGNCTGRKFSQESKKKMSESAKKRGLNQFLIAQQRVKMIFNGLGQKQCNKCFEFKDPTIFRRKSNYCLNCYAKTRPSRSKKMGK